MKYRKNLVRIVLTVSMLCASMPSFAQNDNWHIWLREKIQQHPAVIAAKERWLSAEAGSQALEQPLYNPELSTELERNGNYDNYRVGINQTIDWWDKRGARENQASFLRAAAKARYQQVLLDKTAEALMAQAQWQAASKAQALISEQQTQLDALLSLVEKRKQAGDLGSIDAELTFLSLSTQMTQIAEIEANLQKTESKVRELLPGWTPELNPVPESFWAKSDALDTKPDLLKLPLIASARSHWQALDEAAEATRRNAKAEPTIGINAGRDGDENVVGLSFSIPINVRNNYSAETRAAKREALEAEAQFRAIYRKQEFNWKAAHAAWQRFNQQYQRWQSQVLKRIQHSEALLKRQWLSGDLSTADYLLALNQRSESLLAGITLEKQTRLELIELLLASGQLADIAGQPSMTTN